MKAFHTKSMRRFYIIKIIQEYCVIAIGTLIMSIVISSVFDAMDIVVGGVTGIAIMLKNLFQIPIWIVNAVFNVPLFIAGFSLLEKKSFYKTLFASVTLTLFLGVIPKIDILTDDIMVNLVLGGVLIGIGHGVIFSSGASSGGTDLLATIINLKVRYISIPKLLAIIDTIIVGTGAIVFGLTKGIYSVIAIYILTVVADYIMAGIKKKRFCILLPIKKRR